MQPNVNLNLVLDQVAKDKGIERAMLVATLEEAIADRRQEALRPGAQPRGQVRRGQGRGRAVPGDHRRRRAHRGPRSRPVNQIPLDERAREGHRGRGRRRARLPDLLPRRGRRGGAAPRTSSTATSSSSRPTAAASAASPRRPRSRSSSSASATPSARTSSTSTRTARASSSPASSAASSAATSSSTSAAPRPCCRCASRCRARPTAPATASQAYVLDVLREAQGPADHPVARRRSSCSRSSSRWRSPRSPRASSSSRPPPASRAAAPKIAVSLARLATSIRSARASA